MIQSEREVAAVLDSLHVAWEYEPRLFVFREDDKGFVREGFRPDFYLPKYDFYIEVTKAKQANVTGKNKKVRTVRELYPEIRIAVIYRRDFDNLRARILELLQEAKDTL